MPSPSDPTTGPAASEQAARGPRRLPPYPPYRYGRAGYHVLCTVCGRGRRGHDLRCIRPLHCRVCERATRHMLHPEEAPF
jgi:hypothetical protein